MKTLIMIILLAGTQLFADNSRAPSALNTENEIAILKKEIRNLRIENASLKTKLVRLEVKGRPKSSINNIKLKITIEKEKLKIAVKEKEKVERTIKADFAFKRRNNRREYNLIRYDLKKLESKIKRYEKSIKILIIKYKSIKSGSV